MKKIKITNENYELRITQIRKFALEKKQENWEFRSMLKASEINSDTIDTTAHAIYDHLKASIDCTSCGYCCKVITPIISSADIRRIARYFKLSEKETFHRWFTEHEQLGIVMNSRPCPFYKNKKCSIYPARPHDCRSYPHLHKKGLIRYFTSIFSHIDLCPMVYHFYECMKQQFRKNLNPKKMTWL